VRTFQDRQHAKGFVVLDKSHATHVGRKIVDPPDSFDRFSARLNNGQVEPLVVGLGSDLMPFGKGLNVNGSNDQSLVYQVLNQVTPDEAPSTRY
jgi:hypothetical protein